jgi:curli biogenesis system outer membrane secretion channel CsgG
VFLSPCAFTQDITVPEQLYQALQGRGYLTLAVPDFLNSDGTVSALGRQLRDEAINYFTSSNPQIKILERERLDAVLAELNLQSSGSIQENDSIALGELLGADAVIIGVLAKYHSSRIVFTTRIVDIRSGIILSSGSTQIRGMRSVRLYDRKE